VHSPIPILSSSCARWSLGRPKSSSSILAVSAREEALRVFSSRSVVTLESRIMPGCVGGSRRDHRRGRAKVHRRRGLWASRRCSIEDKVLRGCRFDLESDYISFFRNSGVNPLFYFAIHFPRYLTSIPNHLGIAGRSRLLRPSYLR